MCDTCDYNERKMEDKINRKIEEVNLNGDKVFLKGSKGIYRVVYPIKVDGKINWKNLLVGGSYWNLVKIGLIVGVILFAAWSYSHDIQAVRDSCQALNIIIP
jgi:hypothetical protein